MLRRRPGRRSGLIPGSGSRRVLSGTLTAPEEAILPGQGEVTRSGLGGDRLPLTHWNVPAWLVRSPWAPSPDPCRLLRARGCHHFRGGRTGRGPEVTCPRPGLL